MATDEPSLGDVIKNAVRDAQDLVRSEIALAKAEAREEVHRLGVGAGLLLGAALCAVITILFLMTTLAWAISDGLEWPVWAGFAVVTLLMAVTAGTLAYVGRSRITASRRMKRTVDTMKENVEWIRARTS